MYYQKVISEILEELGLTGYDPRHIEAYMRLEHGTLNRLSRGQFRREVKICAECVDEDADGAESLAKSFGL